MLQLVYMHMLIQKRMDTGSRVEKTVIDRSKYEKGGRHTHVILT